MKISQRGKYKRIWAIVVALLGVCVLTACILATEHFSETGQIIKIITIVCGCLVFVIAFIGAVALDRAAGYYECRECVNKIRAKIRTDTGHSDQNAKGKFD